MESDREKRMKTSVLASGEGGFGGEAPIKDMFILNKGSLNPNKGQVCPFLGKSKMSLPVHGPVLVGR